jgi:hypothetical protein
MIALGENKEGHFMSILHDQMKAEKDEQAKRLNASNDQKTGDLLPMLQERFGGFKVAHGQVELRAEILCRPTCDLAVVKPYKATFIGVVTNPVPDWLMPREFETTILLAARYLPNGKIELFRKARPGLRDTTCECSTPDELFGVMERHLTEIARL